MLGNNNSPLIKYQGKQSYKGLFFQVHVPMVILQLNKILWIVIKIFFKKQILDEKTILFIDTMWCCI